MEDREQLLIYDEIETNLDILGVTGVHEKL